MTHTAPKVTASFTLHGAEFKDAEVLNPGGWSGRCWLMEIGGSYAPHLVIVEADSITDAIDELIDSKYDHQFVIPESDYADYGIDSEGNGDCYWGGNNDRPCDLQHLAYHGDDWTGFECLYHVEGWDAPVKPTELSTVIEHLETRAQCEDAVKGPGKYEGEASYVPHFWDGDANEEFDTRDGVPVWRYEVTVDDRLIFPDLDGVDNVHLTLRDDGFVCEIIAPADDDRAEYDEDGNLVDPNA